MPRRGKILYKKKHHVLMIVKKIEYINIYIMEIV